MTTEKLYTLPDLPAAPYSDLQALLRRLLEHKDMSALRGIFDVLEEQGRNIDSAGFKTEVGALAFKMDKHNGLDSFDWRAFCTSAVRRFFFDLFCLEGFIKYVDDVEVDKEPDVPPVYVATVDIPTGSRFEITWDGDVRLLDRENTQ